MNRGSSITRVWRVISRIRPSSQTNPTCPTCPTCPTSPTCPTAGYTLIELVSVAALAVVLIGLSVGGYHIWTRDTAVDAARRQVQASLARARAYALARGVETRFVAINSNEIQRCFTVLDYRTTNDWVSFTATNPLPRYVGVDSEAMRSGGEIPSEETHLYFYPDGTLRWEDDWYENSQDQFQHHLRLTLFHMKKADDPRYHRYLDISRLTGLVREVPP